jgi:hypothetical protein
VGEVTRKPQAEAAEELAARLERDAETPDIRVKSVSPLTADQARTIAAALRRLAKLEAAAREAAITLEALRDNGWLKDKRAVGPDCTRAAKLVRTALGDDK